MAADLRKIAEALENIHERLKELVDLEKHHQKIKYDRYQ